jgi:hypothetical protein
MAKDIGLSIPKPSKKPKTKNEINKKENAKTTSEPESNAFADLNFKVSQEFKWEFKAWATNHKMSQKAALEKAFELLKKS